MPAPSWRSPISAPARIGNDSAGIATRHTEEFLPTSRVIIGNRCGIIISPPMAAARIPTGASSSQPNPRSEASGRDRCRLTAIAAIASASVTANFRSKNGLRIATIRSGLTPSSVKNIRSETGAAAKSASISAKTDGPRPVRIVGR